MADQEVSLDASSSKYGYIAHLRTYDSHSVPGNATKSAYQGNRGSEIRDWSKEKKTGNKMKLYRVMYLPTTTVRQYFHKGLLWRTSDQAEVASFALFVDLLLFDLLAINGGSVAGNPIGDELSCLTIMFIMSWKIWSDSVLIISWFETDDLFQRISVLFIMACLLGLTVNMLEAFNDTYTQQHSSSHLGSP
ncbi:hypothetical protein BJ878DRAFT_542135 [Calycina marina]|uniref:Uncharacterized protein n=1 Tax=Calycina marina TaxID=1763456 RepID=A0A9P7Z3R9_9HELO|nr:hypothetical protein BJ878DRAFT_542135 [Calycina marina]